MDPPDLPRATPSPHARAAPTAAFSAPGTSGIGCLLLHGLTSNPSSLRPLAEALAAGGHAVELPRLPGHGTRWRDLQRTTWRDWAREAWTGLALLRARTAVQVAVGLSMGGTLALHLAARERDLAAAALINPSLRIRDPRLRLLPVLQWVVPTLGAIGDDIARPGVTEAPYGRLPLRALASLVDLQGRVRGELGQVTCPLLVLTSDHDHVVDPADSDLVADGVASDEVERVRLRRSYHVATLDHDAAVIERRVAALVARVAADAAAR